MHNEKDSGKSDAEDQENNFDWDLSVSEEELSKEDEVEIAPNLSATNDATTTTLIVTSNSDQSPVSLNPTVVDRTAVKRQQRTELNKCLEVLVPMKEEDELCTMYSQNNRVYLGGADKCQINLWVLFTYYWIVT